MLVVSSVPTGYYFPASLPFLSKSGQGSGAGGVREDCEVVSVEGAKLRFSQTFLPSLGWGPQLPLTQWLEANTCHLTREVGLRHLK